MRNISLLCSSQLESFTYLSGAGSGSVPFPDFCVIQNGCRKNFFSFVFGFYAEILKQRVVYSREVMELAKATTFVLVCLKIVLFFVDGTPECT